MLHFIWEHFMLFNVKLISQYVVNNTVHTFYYAHLTPYIVPMHLIYKFVMFIARNKLFSSHDYNILFWVPIENYRKIHLLLCRSMSIPILKIIQRQWSWCQSLHRKQSCAPYIVSLKGNASLAAFNHNLSWANTLTHVMPVTFSKLWNKSLLCDTHIHVHIHKSTPTPNLKSY